MNHQIDSRDYNLFINDCSRIFNAMTITDQIQDKLKKKKNRQKSVHEQFLGNAFPSDLPVGNFLD